MNIILENGVGEIEEKKSRFIAHIYKVTSEEEAELYINAVKKKYWDARHNCYAYVIGDKGELQRFSDDGEPQGTAGKPMLDIINTSNLINCLVIVTRYFGGVLLGTGGLIRAYQGAAKAGLDNSQTAELKKGIQASLCADYTAYGKLQYICNELLVDILDTDFGENVTMKLAVSSEIIDTFENKITDAFSGKITLKDKQNINFCKKSTGEIIIL